MWAGNNITPPPRRAGASVTDARTRPARQRGEDTFRENQRNPQIIVYVGRGGLCASSNRPYGGGVAWPFQGSFLTSPPPSIINWRSQWPRNLPGWASSV